MYIPQKSNDVMPMTQKAQRYRQVKKKPKKIIAPLNIEICEMSHATKDNTYIIKRNNLFFFYVHFY